MLWLKKVRLWSRALFRKDRFESEMDDELRFHMESQIEDLIKAGMSPEEARRAVLLLFGGMDKAKEECRESRPLHMLDTLWQDLRYSLRVLAMNPGFTSVAVLTLALGIGANTAAVSIIDTFLFRPFPVWQPDRLVWLSSFCSTPDFFDYRNDGQVFSDMAAVRNLGASFSSDQSADSLTAECVTANYFDLLGLKMAAGRGFRNDEDEYQGGHSVAIISYRYWKRALRADPEIVGKTLRLNEEPLTVVGVAPEGFRGLQLEAPPPDVWFPVSILESVLHLEKDPIWHNVHLRRQDRWISVVGRLKPDVSLENASARLDVVSVRLKKAYPQSNKDWNPALNPINKHLPGNKDLRFFLAILLITALCLLLISCSNIANLLFAKAIARQREIATRLAVGATRIRLIRQLLTEALTLSLLSLVVSFWIFRLVLESLPYLARSLSLPLDIPVTIDRRVLSFAVVITALTTLISGLTPAMLAARTELISALKHQSLQNVRFVRFRWRSLLVVSQIVLSVILLIAAGLFVRTIQHLQSVDLGFLPDKGIVLSTSLNSKYGYDVPRGIRFCRRSLELIRALPGVRSAAWAAGPPLQSRFGNRIRSEPPNEGSDRWRFIEINFVTSAYFNTLGIPMLRGRDFDNHDDDKSPGVVIVNETLARRYWPEQDPLGKCIQVKDDGGGQFHGPFEVIGVVKDAKYGTLWEGAKPYAYFLHYQCPYFHFVLHVSALGDPRTLLTPVAKTIEIAEPGIPVRPQLLSELIDSSFSQERSMVLLFGTFGLIGLVLMAVGLYGVMSFVFTQRTHEFGIRMALGARRRDILKQVCLEGIAKVLIGLAVALPISFSLTRFIASRLHGVSPFDPITYVAISVLCIAVAFLAVLLPARRATANPMDALRSE